MQGEESSYCLLNLMRFLMLVTAYWSFLMLKLLQKSTSLKPMNKNLVCSSIAKLQKKEGLYVKSSRFINILLPLISVFIGLVAGGIIMLMYGYNPIAGFLALWNGAFGDIYFIGETLRQVTPYILTGLAVAFAFRAGLFNIGAEGQVIVS